jgi:HTH-like domain
LYYQPRPASAEEVRLKHRIDEVYTHCPFYGSRKIAAQLQREGMGINRKTVARYMQEMGIAAIYPGPNLSKRNHKEGVYPYLLRHITSAYPNHIWGIDITYIRLRAGWMYLVAILDWYSRYVKRLGTRSNLGVALCAQRSPTGIGASGATDLQQRSRQQFYQSTVLPTAASCQCPDQHGWPRASFGHYFYREGAPMRTHSPCWRSPTSLEQR